MRKHSAIPFRAKYDQKEIFDALKVVEGSPGEYIATKLWELELMIRLQLNEQEYVKIPVEERARMICATKLPQWMEILEGDRQLKEFESKRLKK